MSTDDITALYGALSDTATALTGRYIELGEAARTPEEEEFWDTEVMGLREERRRIDSTDREAVLEHTRRWARELAELER
ncbi:hypothetical protein NI17_009445 [Thermobifida halotolerans]|uniref:Uncharacterized protein n=1 Tax=Thermobifida halotolerans TaxID=483545 RepID=A0A399FWS1_9ACTN|nr:hypothetical protein [Thermobifida halotolerans]UOE21322.1 hypothetical protein NI17_009445 [Thermobifida halotolerans]